MYLLQLLDHHVCSGTTLLLLSLCQSISIGWVYGRWMSTCFYVNNVIEADFADSPVPEGSERFYKNITDMIGYRPNPFMKYCWTFITPFMCFVRILPQISLSIWWSSIDKKEIENHFNPIKFLCYSEFSGNKCKLLFSQGTFLFSIVKYTPLRFSDTYVYPLWANILGWFIATSSLSLIPLFVLYKMARGEGTLQQVSPILNKWQTVLVDVYIWMVLQSGNFLKSLWESWTQELSPDMFKPHGS